MREGGREGQVGIVDDSARYVVNQAGQVGSGNTRGTLPSTILVSNRVVRASYASPRFPLLSLFPKRRTSETC